MAMMTGREALMEILRSEGVEYVFGLPGSTETLFLDALEDHPEIKYILGLHESVAAAIADGYCRASGKVGVVNLHASVGLGSAMPILLDAGTGGVPLVVTAGRQNLHIVMQEPSLGGDLIGIGKRFAKWSTEVSYAHDLAMVMRRAFKVAAEAPTGPVFVSLPQNVLAESLDFEYLPNPPLALSRRRPDQGTIDKATELIAGAQTPPTMIVGSGVAKDEALPEVVKLAELIGARVYQPFPPDVNFPTNHPQYLGELGSSGFDLREVLQSSDVLVAVGVPLFKRESPPSNPVLTARTKVIQIDNDPWEIAKNFAVAVGIEGDIRLCLTDLNDALQKKMPIEARQAARAKAREIAKEKEDIKKTFLKNAQAERDNVPISVSRLMQDLGDCLKPRTVVVDDCWSCSATVRRYIDFTEAKSYYRSRGASIGWGMPASLGIKLALPDRPVAAVVGDGSAMWSFQSLWTAASYNIPVTYVICSNTSYRLVKQIKILQMGEQARGRFLGMDFDMPTIDFCQLAQAMGVWGQRVERPEELKEALSSALESDKPTLVEVVVEGTV